MIWIHDYNPVAIHLWNLEIRWYGLVYIIGFLASLWWILNAAKQNKENKKDHWLRKIIHQQNIFFGMFFSGVVGGRIGEFLWYSEWKNFREIFKIWQGGMSMHGGILGAIIFLWFFIWWKTDQEIFAKKWHRVSQYFWKILDFVVVPFSLVLVFGRIANFINSEIIGIPTAAHWGVIFTAIDDIPRHPVQLYEASLMIILFAALLGIRKNFAKKLSNGVLSGGFILGYSSLRLIAEAWKDNSIYSEGSPAIWLCFTGIIIGGIVIVKSKIFAKFLSS